MSRNFELLQQLELVAPVEVHATSKPQHRELRDIGLSIATSRWICDEALGVVQRIFQPQKQGSPRVAVFSAVNPGDGCTRICASVAETLAGNGYGPVCIVEANFHSPALPGLYDVTNHNGLAEALLHDDPIRSFAKPVGADGLWLLSCGGCATSWPNLLSSERIRPRLDELRKEFTYVFIDTPPLTRSTDAIALGHLTDGAVLILEAESTRRESAQMAISTLRSARIPILGAVLNKRTFPIPEQIYKRI